MLKLKNLSFSATDGSGEKEIVRGVNLNFEKNKLIAITGPNGGGKSTLARLIAGIEKPTSGRIFFLGEDITDLSVTERARRGIAFAFQQPVRFKGINVLDLIRIASGKKISVSDACLYLSAVGLCARDYIGREVNASLSGGELKRIEIATVIARGARLSIFDEPEAGIDLWSFNNLIEVFENLRETVKDSTIVVISHQERILKTADEIVVLSGGAVVRHGKRDDVLGELIGTSSAVNYCTGTAEERGGAEVC